jgi:hypothetical protein
MDHVHHVHGRVEGIRLIDLSYYTVPVQLYLHPRLQLDLDGHHGITQKPRDEQPLVPSLFDNHGRTRTPQDRAVVLEQNARLVDARLGPGDVPYDHGILAPCVADRAGERMSFGEPGEDVAAVLAVSRGKVGRVVDRAIEPDAVLQVEFRRGGEFERAEVEDAAGGVAEHDLAVRAVA